MRSVGARLHHVQSATLKEECGRRVSFGVEKHRRSGFLACVCCHFQSQLLFDDLLGLVQSEQGASERLEAVYALRFSRYVFGVVHRLLHS